MEFENIPNIKTTKPINFEELDNVDDYLKEGFHTLAICSHGIARSFKHAEHLTREGQPTLFLEGGLSELNDITNANMRSQFIKQIKSFPNREFLLTPQEIRKYSDLIYRIGGCIVRCDLEAININKGK